MTENKLIFEHEFSKGTRISFDDGCLTIGNMKITSKHEQDCCENVYAEFSVFEHYAESINGMGISKMEIKAVEDMGVVFFFYGNGDDTHIGVLVNCYNIQNGYYSSDLSLIIKIDGNEQEIGISEVVYDIID